VLVHPHLVFGYGSLICPASQAITAPSVADRGATPVTVQNVERTWAKQSLKLTATSMGVRFRDGAECVGVLVPVNDNELAAFDERVIGYDRFEIPFDDIEAWSEEDASFFQDSDNDMTPQIWMYVPQVPTPATSDYPIAQSYVDIMLRGCLTISEEFTHEFIQTTKGWDPTELMEASDESDYDMMDADSDSGYDSDSDDEGWWVDDRRDPLYIRADPDYSLKHAKKLDQLLRHNLPQKFQRRVRKGRTQVRGQQQAQEQTV
jgi:hypothetical protein